VIISPAKAREVLEEIGLRDAYYIWWEKIIGGEYV
jgi:hypothetical protein